MDQVAKVFFNEQFIGILTRRAKTFVFQYDREFLALNDSFPIGYNFPLREKEFISEKLFPFFEGLVSEGWLLKIQSQSQKIDENDCFSMLIKNGEDLIGGVKVRL